jgi:hypothetical protein
VVGVTIRLKDVFLEKLAPFPGVVKRDAVVDPFPDLAARIAQDRRMAVPDRLRHLTHLLDVLV